MLIERGHPHPPKVPRGHPLTRLLGFPPEAGEAGASGTSFSVMLRGEEQGWRWLGQFHPAGWAVPPLPILQPLPGLVLPGGTPGSLQDRHPPSVLQPLPGLDLPGEPRVHPQCPSHSPARAGFALLSLRARLEEVGARPKAWHIPWLRCQPLGYLHVPTLARAFPSHRETTDGAALGPSVSSGGTDGHHPAGTGAGAAPASPKPSRCHLGQPSLLCFQPDLPGLGGTHSSQENQ